MYCVRKVNEDYTWIGADSRRLAVFEGVFGVPEGVSYNSYLLLDEKTVLFDTVDAQVIRQFRENLLHTLSGRTLDYIVVHHMEPDHTAELEDLVLRFPEVQILCTAMAKTMIGQFFGHAYDDRIHVCKEGDTLCTGRHTLQFVMAPMVHWPEVMMTYDRTDKLLLSADAFGCFGALNGALFADEVDFDRDYLDEARRYYTNIVGKYGPQVQTVLQKAGTLDIRMLLPLHGFVWRKDLGYFIDKYDKWSRYEPEVKGVLIVYASMYGNTEAAAQALAARLGEQYPAAVVTGLPVGRFLMNAGVQKGRSPFTVQRVKIGRSYPGTGDLFGSILVGALLEGQALSAAAALAADFVADAIAATPEEADSRFGVQFEPMLGRLAKR